MRGYYRILLLNHLWNSVFLIYMLCFHPLYDTECPAVDTLDGDPLGTQHPDRNHRLFVPKTFRSEERKVHMENFRPQGTKVPGTFVPKTFRSRELSFSGNKSSRELSFPGPFVHRNFRSHICVRWFITAV